VYVRDGAATDRTIGTYRSVFLGITNLELPNRCLSLPEIEPKGTRRYSTHDGGLYKCAARNICSHRVPKIVTNLPK